MKLTIPAIFIGSLAVIGAAALVTLNSSEPAEPDCKLIKPASIERSEPHQRFAQPPPPPAPSSPGPATVPVA